VSLPRELQDLTAPGPLAHLTTINADSSPRVSVIWMGLAGDEVVSGRMLRTRRGGENRRRAWWPNTADRAFRR
jgi:hypothetical protein